jgi:hypothetical protein
MGVWEIMQIDKSIEKLKQKLKSGSVPSGSPMLTPRQEKSIDPSIDRSRLDESINFAAARSTNAGKLQIDRKDIEGCRDCPEGMQW